MADNVHITRISGSTATIRGNINPHQSAIDTTLNRHVYSDATPAYVYVGAASQKIAVADGAVTYLDETFNDVNVNADLTVGNKIYRASDADTYIDLSGEDQINIVAGDKGFVEFLENTGSQHYEWHNYTGDDIDFRIDSSGVERALFVQGSDGLVSTAGKINVDATTDATSTIDGSLQTDGGLSVVKRIVAGDDIAVLADNKNLELGAGSDMSIYYDGTNGNIDTDLVAASDLVIDCGTAKTLVLEVPVYNDANVGGMALRAGVTNPPVTQIVDNLGANTGIYSLGFADLDEANGAIEIPHDYKEGTNLSFHVHWGANAAPSDTDYVKWTLTYTVIRNGVTTAPATPIHVETAYDTQYENILSVFDDIVGTNYKIGDQFVFNIKRAVADGAAYAGVAILQTIGFHYQCDTMGSRLIDTK